MSARLTVLHSRNFICPRRVPAQDALAPQSGSIGWVLEYVVSVCVTYGALPPAGCRAYLATRHLPCLVAPALNGKNPPLHDPQAVLLSVRAAPSLPAHPAQWPGATTRAGRDRRPGPQPDRPLTPWHREPGQPRIGAPPSAAHTALLRGQMHLSRGYQPGPGWSTAASPGSQTHVSGTLGARVTYTGRGSRQRRSGQGRLGCTRVGHSCMLTVRDGRCCSCSRFCTGALGGSFLIPE